MTIYAYGDRVPEIDETAFVHPDAVIIGSVKIGALSTIWPGAVLRGDDGEIKIGARTSIQDNTVIHTMPNQPTIVGDDCVIGHIVHLESCTIHDGAQVSSGAIVLHRAVVGSGAIVAANSVVLNDTIIPPGALAVGSPATIKEGRARSIEIELGAQIYVEKGKKFRTDLRKISD
ncbi:MAG: gamma carbonic anhydrase family protein [Actinobacteria bacterium]|nr:MAG: gamma carbonic anhydrase family protein [Actinomycetota bacterium]